MKNKTRRALELLAAVGALALLLASLAQRANGAAPAPSKPAPAKAAPAKAVRQLSISNKPWTGDLDKLLERRMIRVLVPFSRTLFYTDKGRERGITADVVREFERYLNQKYKTGKRPVTLYLIPTTRDRLLPDIAAGLGDIAAGNLTVTPDRQRTVDFAVQGERNAREIVVTGAKAQPPPSLDALSGRTVHVRKSSSYYESLLALNQRYRQAKRPEAVLRLVPDALEDEDMMEMANAGLIDALGVDDWKAKVWAQVLPRIAVHKNVCVREEGQIGWAIRKGSPQLMAAIDDFHGNVARKNASYEYRLAQTMRRVKQIKDPTQSADWKRFEEMQALFRRYGNQYHFDPLMLIAQGYQESQLNQKAKSHVGAIGVMQLMPATGAEMKGGDIRITEDNIHAGAKYLDQLMTKFFPDAHFTEGNRPLFAFASS